MPQSFVEATLKNVSLAFIQKHGRWKSERTVDRYIEEEWRFEDSAVTAL